MNDNDCMTGERHELLKKHKSHDQLVFAVRPDLVLDTTADDADWIRNPIFWRRHQATDDREPDA